MILDKLKKEYENARDVTVKELICSNREIIIIYQNILSDINLFNYQYIPIIRESNLFLDSLFPGIVEEINKPDSLDEIIFRGDIVLIEKAKYYIFKKNNIPDRSINDSIAEPDNVLGSRDGFNENINTNIALIRTRLKIKDLIMDEFIIGERSKTKVVILSIDSICNKEMKNDLLEKIKGIKIDCLYTITDISSNISDARIVPLSSYTGSPESAAIALLSGQFVILIDRIPVSLVLPTSLFFLTKEKSDLQIPLYYSLFSRFFLLIGLFTSIFSLAILYSFLTYQSSDLSESFLNLIKLSQRGVLVPAFLEILVMLSIFEFYQFVSARSPGITVQTIIIVVGGFLIGQNTVQSGVVGVVIITVTAFAYFSGYIISNNTTILISISILRIFLLLCSLIYGLYGVVLGSILVILYLYNQKSLGLSFSHPFVPFNIKDVYKFFIPRASKFYKERPDELNLNDKVIKK